MADRITTIPKKAGAVVNEAGVSKLVVLEAKSWGMVEAWLRGERAAVLEEFSKMSGASAALLALMVVERLGELGENFEALDLALRHAVGGGL